MTHQRALSRLAVLMAVLLAVGLLPLTAGAQLPGDDEENGGGEEQQQQDETAPAERDRLSGANRFDTARLVAEDAHPDGATTVVIARGDDFPDALAAAYLAGQEAAPVLLVEPDRLPDETEQGLGTLGAEDVVVLGGTAAVSEQVVAELEALGLAVQRVAGGDRYETARRVAEEGEEIGMFGMEPLPVPVPTVILATGEVFADALASGPLAYGGALPILLTPTDTLSPHAREFLEDEENGVEQVLIAGGTAAVSEDVEAELEEMDMQVQRVAGEERTETAALLAQATADNQDWELATVGLALSQDFPDALALGPGVGAQQSVLVLSLTPEMIGPATGDFLAGACADVTTLKIAGGTAVITDDAATEGARAAACRVVSTVTVDPEESEAPVGTDHEVTVTVLDQFDEPVAEANVRVEVFRGEEEMQEGDFPDSPPEEQFDGTSDEDGQFTTESWTSEEEAVDTIVGCSSQSPITSCVVEGQFNEDLPHGRAVHRWVQ